ncbi:MAG: tRNA dihydrouridine(20/20a) synthase DusA [Nevskiales bacterium]|nr:tRNA dihydrouridine(20/20a) synthase DusA [Nevskiales bacterium]
MSDYNSRMPHAHSPHRFCVAPMMEWTDRHCRYFHRQLSRHARLYTEMVPTGALIHGEPKLSLRFDPAEHPVALQLGGNDPDELAQCAELGDRFGYHEINLNCGCPSDRVQEGRFGACLMRDPQRVADCIAAMRKATDRPVTVKNRIGVDDSRDYEFLRRFVSIVAEAGCETFIIHARKAWLHGLSPKENREIPPLQYELVYRLKQEFPQLTIVINGGIKSLDECAQHLQQVDGVMLGREVYENPYLLAAVDPALFNAGIEPIARDAALRALRPYVERELARGAGLHHITRHVLGLYRGQPGGRGFRRLLAEGASRPHEVNWTLIEEALATVESAALSLAA